MASDVDWKEVSLGEVIELKRGYDLPKDKRTPGSVPIVSSSGVSDFHAEAMVKGPGVVTGRYGTIGEVFYVNEDYWPLNTTLYVRDFKGNDPRFISYFLKTLDFQAYSDKGAVPGLNRNHLHLAKVRLPGKSAQRSIARVLSCLDSKIDLNRRINQTLEAMAQAIFRSWFVDFDPVKAKMAALAEGRDPLRAAMSAISGKADAEFDALPPEAFEQLAATAALFPDEMEESELGQIPKGWAVHSAESLAEVGIGKTPPRKEPQWFTEGDGDWRWVSIKDMGASGVFQQKSSEFLTAEAVSRFNVRVVPDRTVLLSFKLTIGRVAITEGPMVTNEAIAHFKLPNDAAISSEYLYLYLKSFDYSTLGSTSSIADAVNSKTIRGLPIAVAERTLIVRFTRTVVPHFEEMRSRQNEIASLCATRDALLPKLLSGEIEVPA
ncbi:restriction endonuclease subunit S [Zoogloea sp.]|uniref:restriction endonuclease subunit S n=1 Tax=Zoogloea sp. TaxID=49181 RepID=UPI001ACE1C74|nr:restriction endonuclease subunit S [Zoogloea sp.]MBN8283857.1 restriction endonuclease subunit S [Zoogloea sp.]